MNNSKLKYKLIKEKGTSLFRIKALIDIGTNIKKGDLGGLVESEENLAQTGDAWVYGAALVYGDARVFENAQVYEVARIYGAALVYGDARVTGLAQVYGTAQVYGDARVYGAARVQFGDSKINLGKNLLKNIQVTFNVVPLNNKFIFYKRVSKTNIINTFSSLYDKTFIYKIGKYALVRDPDLNVLKSCTSGIHVSHLTYWTEGDTLLQLEVDIKDIICCQEGKLRCKRIKVLGVVNE